MSKKDITINFTSNVINEQGKKDIADIINNLLLTTLTRRTFFWQLVHNRPFHDDYETTDARTYFQCGLVCAMNDEFQEALEWYTMGSKCFTNSSVLYNEEVQCDYDYDDYKYDVSVMTWFNTPYGSKQELMDVAKIHCWDLHMCDMDGNDVINRIAVLKDEWFALIAKERQCIAANKAALEELDAQRGEN